jgi:hypothetical protein
MPVRLSQKQPELKAFRKVFLPLFAVVVFPFKNPQLKIQQ